jgi:excinuclease ABC subunit C
MSFKQSMMDHGIQAIKKTLDTLPHKPGVYRMLNTKGEVLYIGKAKDLKNRVSFYIQVAKLSNRLQRMIAETERMEIVTTRTEIEALLLESNLIKKYLPRYNILLKDDKSFPYIVVAEDHPFPRVLKHRGTKTIQGKYFGPYASVTAVEECLIMLQKVFLLRNCSDTFFAARTRPCLQYHIKRCSAPCVHKINRHAYAQNVKQAINFMNGKSDKIHQFLIERMQQASEALAYEEAAEYRDRLRLFNKIQVKQRVNIPGIVDADVIAAATQGNQTCIQVFFFRHGQNLGTESFFLSPVEDSSLEERLSAFINQFYAEREPTQQVLLSHQPSEAKLIKESLEEKYNLTLSWQVPQKGPKRELVEHALSNAHEALQRKFAEKASFTKHLEELATLFNLPTQPARIEVYDNSHLQGSHPYGAMIVTDEHGFNKKAYRKFSIKSSGPGFGGDDYAMMREVLKRRFSRVQEENWNLPDLLLLDGGEGQLNVALEVIQELDIDGLVVVSIAKGPERNAGRERFFMPGKEPFTLPPQSSVLHFLQRLRDEAHRFAIGTHRAGRQRSLTKSKLDEIPGIGIKRKKALLQYFGSLANVAAAEIEDLKKAPGINKFVAKIIYQYFHGS